MTHPAVPIQISPESQPSTASWFGEVAAFARVLAHLGKLAAVKERVRFRGYSRDSWYRVAPPGY